MIDLTPLDVRNKRGDFKRLMRGYDPQEVDVFLEMTADRLEVLVRENLQLKERTQSLQDKVSTQTDREQAVQDALVTAQELRADIRAQAQRDAEKMVDDARIAAERILSDAEAAAKRLISEAEAESIQRVRELERRLEEAGVTIQDLERRRIRFLKEFRGLLARELDVVEVEEGKLPFEERAIDLELGSGRSAERVVLAAEAVSETAEPTVDPVATADDEPDTGSEEQEASSESREPTPDELDAPGGERGRDTGSGKGGASHREAVAPPVAPSRLEGPASRRGGDPDAASDDRRSDGPVPYPVLNVPKNRGEGVRFAVDLDRDRDPTPRSSSDEPVDVADLGPGDSRFSGVPDLETVLAEAGMEEVKPPTDQVAGPDNSFILFDFDEKGEKES